MSETIEKPVAPWTVNSCIIEQACIREMDEMGYRVELHSVYAELLNSGRGAGRVAGRTFIVFNNTTGMQLEVKNQSSFSLKELQEIVQGFQNIEKPLPLMEFLVEFANGKSATIKGPTFDLAFESAGYNNQAFKAIKKFSKVSAEE